jgi:hypothetical protein
MPKVNRFVTMSAAVYLMVAMAIVGCLFGVKYKAVVVSKVCVESIANTGKDGLVVVARYFSDAGIVKGGHVTRIEGVGSGIYCDITGAIIEVDKKAADSLKYMKIYIGPHPNEAILRDLTRISQYENIKIDGAYEPLFSKLRRQLLWAIRFH